MPLLTARDPLPGCPRRVLVAGTSGSGKTTLARRIGDVLQVPHVELDALFHGPVWTPRADFEADVRRFVATDAWVTEWSYSGVRPLLAERADLLVWLDLSRRLVIGQVVRRTLRRRLRREVLWNGNVEPALRTFFTDSEHIVRWAWSTYDESAQRVAALRQERPNLAVVQLTSRNAVERWINGPLLDASARSRRSASD